jgi:hypothetical protein
MSRLPTKEGSPYQPWYTKNNNNANSANTYNNTNDTDNTNTHSTNTQSTNAHTPNTTPSNNTSRPYTRRTQPQSIRPPRQANNTRSRGVLSPMIRVKSIYPGYRHWVRFYQGQIYKTIDNGDNIYHWHLDSHNFFDIEENRRTSKGSRIYLAFTDPDYEVRQLDKAPRYAEDTDPNNKVNIRSIINYAKWNGIKFKPNSYIARSYEQIEEALRHISYCMVKSHSDEDADTTNSNDSANSNPNTTSNANSNANANATSNTNSNSGSNSNSNANSNANSSSNSNANSGSNSNYGYGYSYGGESGGEDEDILARSLRIVYPTQPPQNIHDEVQQWSTKVDIMATSPLGCLESPTDRHLM